MENIFHKVWLIKDTYLVASDNFHTCRISGQWGLPYPTCKKGKAELKHK